MELPTKEERSAVMKLTRQDTEKRAEGGPPVVERLIGEVGMLMSERVKLQEGMRMLAVGLNQAVPIKAIGAI